MAGTLEKRISARKQNIQPGSPILLTKVDTGAVHPGKSTVRGKSNFHGPFREQIYGEGRFRFLRRPNRFLIHRESAYATSVVGLRLI